MSYTLAKQHPNFHHPELAEVYDSIKISPRIPRALSHEILDRTLRELKKHHGQHFQIEKVGQSVEERAIYLLTVGTGPRKIFMWSQMHGNEPTATNALLDVFNYILQHRGESFVQEILAGATIHAIPMLNPDGAERFHRRNAQGLDINRDARDLASPEGRVLKSVRDRLQPEFGFNLHDQNGRRTVGNTNKIVAIALLVPPVDERETDTPGTIEAKKVASLIYQSLSPYIYGHIARYDASFMSRAFGDNIQLWGTKTVLIESGGWYDDDPAFLVKMNFIAILEACHAIATGEYALANPGIYDGLAQNDKELFDLLIKDALILDGTRPTPFKGDVGINYAQSYQDGHVLQYGTITDIGDMDTFAAKDTIDAEGHLVVPGLIGLIPEDRAGALEQSHLEYAKKGYTTLLLNHPIGAGVSLAERIAALREAQLQMNFAFVASQDGLVKIPFMEQATVLGDVLSEGALAILKTSRDDAAVHPLTHKLAHWLRRAELAPDEISAARSWPEHLAGQNFQVTQTVAGKLGLFDRGRIRIGDFADLAIYRVKNGNLSKITNSDLAFLLINGNIVYSHGNFVRCENCGNVIIR